MMASTQQSSLNDFFKSTRSARDGLAIKGANKSIVSSANEDNATNSIQPKKIVDTFSIPEVTLASLKSSSKPKIARRTRNVVSKKQVTAKASTESISSVFQRAASLKPVAPSACEKSLKDESQKNEGSVKRVRESDEEDEETSNTEPTEQPSTSEMSAGTPQPKRLKAIAEPSIPAAIGSGVMDSPRATRASARKKIDAGPPPTNSKEVVLEKKASCIKLNKCSKLSELRAQLMKVTQCNSRIDEFRATVQQAKFEAEGAAIAITIAKGGIPSPRKTMCSPLKADPPRKVISTLKNVGGSPCKSAPSPRQAPPHPLLEKFSSLEVEVPISPRKTPSKSPGKSAKSPLSVPAYQRFQHLIRDEPSIPGASEGIVTLSMPYTYRVLREVFRAVDTVVSLLHNRQEVITFSKLRPAVQQMLRRSFVERHLGQLKHMFPLAYIFRQEKMKSGSSAINAAGGNGGANTDFQLTISANLSDAASQQSAPLASLVSSPRVNLLDRFESTPAASPVSATQRSYRPGDGKFRKMDSVMMVERRAAFQSALINTLHQHHAEFLKSLSPPVEITDYSSIKRWHPNFPLDDVPDVPSAALPQPPEKEVLTSAASVLATARDLFSVNPRLEAAVEKVAAAAENSAMKDASTAAKVEQAAQSPEVSLALKGISVSLLAKIRAREAAAASRVMVRSASDTHQLNVLRQLPEIARILRHTTVSERKAALSWEQAVATLRESCSAILGNGNIEEHLEMLLKEAPDFVSKHKLSSGIFIKVNKKSDLNRVIEKLEALLKLKS